MRAATYGNGTFLAVGDSSTILQSANLVRLRISPPAANRAFTITLTGQTGVTNVVEASLNLIDWTPLGVAVNSNGTAQLTGLYTTNFPRRFYRAVSP